MLKTWIKIIALLEIIGGLVGIGFVIWWLLAWPVHYLAFFLAPIPIGIYIFSFVAGIALWHDSPFGRKASIIIQAIQLPKIISPPVIFMFSFGLDFWVQFVTAASLVHMGFEIRLFAFNQLFFNVESAPVGFGISITACVFLGMLLSYKPHDITSEAPTLPPPPPVEWSDNSRA